MRTCWLGLVLALVAAAPSARAQEALPTGEEIVRRVNARDEGESVSRTWGMELVEKDGTIRARTLRSYRRRFADEKRAVLFFEDPPTVKGTALLTFDYADAARPDDQWFYLPALRKSRRVALAERGRAFLGTDFSFEDMKRETQLSLDDYNWQTLGEEVVGGHRCFVVEATPVDERVARELGHGRVRVRVDAEIWFPRFAEYWEPGGAPQKTIRLFDIEKVQEIWTAQRIEAENLATGHRTTLHFREIDFRTQIPEELFSEAALRRGAP
jgi:hypothetical protein